MLPFLFVLYITNYLDRTSLAYAAIGMSRDVGFSDRVLGLGSGIFFISYVTLQIPGALLVERWSARRMISATMIAWGSLTALTALVHSPGELYIARFVLGAAEAGFLASDQGCKVRSVAEGESTEVEQEKAPLCLQRSHSQMIGLLKENAHGNLWSLAVSRRF